MKAIIYHATTTTENWQRAKTRLCAFAQALGDEVVGEYVDMGRCKDGYALAIGDLVARVADRLLVVSWERVSYDKYLLDKLQDYLEARGQSIRSIEDWTDPFDANDLPPYIILNTALSLLAHQNEVAA